MIAHEERRRGQVAIPPCEATQDPRVHERLTLRWDVPLWKSPGTEMSYCNYGYALLGEIVRRVSGQSLMDFTRERIFEPLGMRDTYWHIPAAQKARLARRAEDDPLSKTIADAIRAQIPSAASSLYGTALDAAIFAQMFLNGGCYGGRRVLSAASVAAMTRDQTPGISARWLGEYFPEASWGLGWSVCGRRMSWVALGSPQAFGHAGLGVLFLWVDPTYEIVGAYFSVFSMRGIPPHVRVPQGNEDWFAGRHDMFVNAMTAAVE